MIDLGVEWSRLIAEMSAIDDVTPTIALIQLPFWLPGLLSSHFEPSAKDTSITTIGCFRTPAQKSL
jgi:hypothetical protein